MATMMISYPPHMYHQQMYNYPILTSFYSQQPFQNNYYIPQQQQQQQQKPPQQQRQQKPPQQKQQQQQKPPQQKQQQQQKPPQQKQQKITSVQYVDSAAPSSPPRREPRIYRQVIVLPTPEPIYRQVRRRLPTPERQVIQRTVIQKSNGDVVVQQQRPTTKTRSQSRTEYKTQTRSSRSRQIHTD
jgi:hypothetical protein